MRIEIAFPLAFAVLATAGSGCQSSGNQVLSCQEDSRAEAYVAGMAEIGPGGYTLTLLESEPGPPELGDNHWSIEITDPTGDAAPGLVLELSSLMVDHNHRSPIRPMIVDEGGGQYAIGPVRSQSARIVTVLKPSRKRVVIEIAYE